MLPVITTKTPNDIDARAAQILSDKLRRDRDNFLNKIYNFKSNKSKLFIVNIINDDLNHYQPDLVFVDQYYDFNFLDYFLENAEFRELWQNYHYLTSLTEPGFYKLDIYSRNSKPPSL